MFYYLHQIHSIWLEIQFGQRYGQIEDRNFQELILKGHRPSAQLR